MSRSDLSGIGGDLTGEPAADTHAETRLENLPVRTHTSDAGVVVAIDGDEYAVVACVSNEADGGDVHEGFAAALQHADRAVGLADEEPDPAGGDR